MRLAFMGSPDFALPALEALHGAGHEIACVYSQPPRPAGRGTKSRPTPVHKRAEALGLEVRTPRSLKSVDEQLAFADLELEAAVVVAYGLLLPQPVLDAPRYGCLNSHPSLLPRWRGAAPIQRAIMAGDSVTGVSIMQMDVGLDTGPVLMSWRTPVTRLETAGELHDRLAIKGAGMLLEALANIRRLVPVPQSEQGASYALKIDKEKARIDWNQSAGAIAAHINGLSPIPGAWCEMNGERIKVLLAEPGAQGGQPGQVLAADGSLIIACGKGAVKVHRVQRAGKGPMAADAFLRGFDLSSGAVLRTSFGPF